MKRVIDFDDANITTSFPVADCIEIFEPDPKHPRPLNPLGKFSAGAGAVRQEYNADTACFVRIHVAATSIDKAVADLFAAWKAAESHCPTSTKFKIITWKDSAIIAATVEIADQINLDSIQELGAPMKIAKNIMLEIANSLLARGYECPER